MFVVRTCHKVLRVSWLLWQGKLPVCYIDINFTYLSTNTFPPQNVNINSPEGQTSTAALLGRYLHRWLTHRDGFNIERDFSHGFARKLGIEAIKTNATMQFDFPNVTLPVKILTIHSIKSYGEAWEGSAANFIISKKVSSIIGNETNNGGQWTQVSSQVLSGVHSSESTISYSTEIMFAPIEVGSDVKLEVKLVGGSKFKITGLMFCSR
jgi:hypothetical protein